MHLRLAKVQVVKNVLNKCNSALASCEGAVKNVLMQQCTCCYAVFYVVMCQYNAS